MAEATLVVPDLSRMGEIELLLYTLGLPASAEYVVEPALDYPGQQVAVDLWAATDAELAHVLTTVQRALVRKLKVTARPSDELDHELHAPHNA